MKKIFYYAAIALFTSAMGLTSCQNEDDLTHSGTDGKEVHVTVNVTREGFDNVGTRTSLKENEGDLLCTWSMGDQLLVTNTSGQKLGTLQITEGIGENKATFDGVLVGLKDGSQTLNFFYLGTKADIESIKSSTFDVDFSGKEGTLESLSDHDILSSSIEVNVDNGAFYVEDLELKRNFAFGHFELQFSDGATIRGTEEVKISGENFKSSVTVDLTNATYTSGEGNVIVKGKGNDFYIMLVPTQDVTLGFSVTIGEVEYAGSLIRSIINASDFYRDGTDNSNGVPVKMEKVGGEEPENPDNPGNLDNWGGDVDYPILEKGSFTNIGTSGNAWCSNAQSFQDFGFAAPVEYAYNAIKKGYLTSNSYTNDIEAKYFQWGRWLGFPMNVVYAQVTMTSYTPVGTVAYPRGIDKWDTKLGYCWDMDDRATYAYSSAFRTSNNMEKQQAVNSSSIDLVGDYDYLKSSLHDLSWEERSGNPCPDGYRIPTAEELSQFAPSKPFSGSYAEIKEINGTNYAMKWTVVDDTHVTVSSVQTSKTEITASDEIFNGAKALTFEADGMLYSNNNNIVWATKSDGGNKTSGYWSSTSAVLSGDYKGGMALMVRIKDGICTIKMEVVEYTAGLCIIPIKDATAKATSIKPWFPLGY